MLHSLPHSPGLQDALFVVALLLIPTLMLLAACRKKHSPFPQGKHRPLPALSHPAPRSAQCAALDSLLLPAGMHFRRHTFDTCSGPGRCVTPQAAVLAGIASTAAAAEGRAAQADAARPALPLGYPLVVHTDELGLADAALDGVAVVTGLFRTLTDAHRWHTACGASHPSARVMPLADSRTAFSRLSAEMPRRHYVVRISAGPPAPAYAEQDLEQLHPEAVSPRVAPLCTLKPSRLFVFNTRHIRWYQWAPVRCGNRKAYVRWTRTLLAATVRRGTDGLTLLRQVTRVVLGHPQVTTWRYDAAGRHALQKPQKLKKPANLKKPLEPMKPTGG